MITTHSGFLAFATKAQDLAAKATNADDRKDLEQLAKEFKTGASAASSLVGGPDDLVVFLRLVAASPAASGDDAKRARRRRQLGMLAEAIGRSGGTSDPVPCYGAAAWGYMAAIWPRLGSPDLGSTYAREITEALATPAGQ